jgi:hypothetical protein
MHKVHLKVVLDVLVYSEEGTNIGDCIHSAFDEVVLTGNEDVDIMDFTVESVEVTDSR